MHRRGPHAPRPADGFAFTAYHREAVPHRFTVLDHGRTLAAGGSWRFSTRILRRSGGSALDEFFTAPRIIGKDTFHVVIHRTREGTKTSMDQPVDTAEGPGRLPPPFRRCGVQGGDAAAGGFVGGLPQGLAGAAQGPFLRCGCLRVGEGGVDDDAAQVLMCWATSTRVIWRGGTEGTSLAGPGATGAFGVGSDRSAGRCAMGGGGGVPPRRETAARPPAQPLA